MNFLNKVCLIKVLFMFSGIASAGGDEMQLLKVVSVKDEITVGIAKDTAKGGEAIAKALTDNGYIKVWQYSLGRSKDGSTVQKPMREILLMKGHVIRIESIEPEHTVQALPR